ncbi:hypothetical protein EDB89DRAFT_2085527 [Lactarius sanguifluus]|nr:hypothetical protein EDB89DRAFT_2085527 [Lactarius sanguifluus]
MSTSYTREYEYSSEIAKAALVLNSYSIRVAVAVAIVVSIVVDCRRRGPSSSWAVVVVRLTCLAVAAGVVTSLIAGVDPSGALAGVCLCCVAVTTVVVVQADTSRSWFMVDETQSFPRPVIAKHVDRPAGSAQQYHHQQQQDSDNDNVVLDDATTTTERRQSTTTGATPVNYGNGATSTDIDSDSKTTPPPPTTTMTTTTTGDRDDYLDVYFYLNERVASPYCTLYIIDHHTWDELETTDTLPIGIQQGDDLHAYRGLAGELFPHPQFYPQSRVNRLFYPLTLHRGNNDDDTPTTVQNNSKTGSNNNDNAIDINDERRQDGKPSSNDDDNAIDGGSGAAITRQVTAVTRMR